MSFALRRSLPLALLLLGLPVLVGFAAVDFLAAPLWVPAVLAAVTVAGQWALGPVLLRRLLRPTILTRSGDGYATAHPLGGIVLGACAAAGVPLPEVGLVEDPMPNAFTFGRSRAGASLYVTSGLLERLDERQLTAVVAHEVGHIKHRDFAVMTVASVVPLLLYWMFVLGRSVGRNEARLVALVAYLGYLVGQLLLLALSRVRELGADRWACESTADGDALASALLSISYGMGQVSAARRVALEELRSSGRKGARQAARLAASADRRRPAMTLGIADPGRSEGLVTSCGTRPPTSLAPLRWDLESPWAPVLERLSTHPLTARRIEALARSGLPGAPTGWLDLPPRPAKAVPPPPARTVAAQTVIAVLPWAVLVTVFAGYLDSSAELAGLGILLAGIALFAKRVLRFPARFGADGDIASLRERLDAGPVAGIGVVLRGVLVCSRRGRPSAVLQDGSGFVTLRVTSRIAWLFRRSLRRRLGALDGAQVEVTGWYRRLPMPVVEAAEVRAWDGQRPVGWSRLARYWWPAAVTVVGLLVLLGGLPAGH